MVRNYNAPQSYRNGDNYQEQFDYRPPNRSYQNQRGRNSFRRGNRRNFDFDRSRGVYTQMGYRQPYKNPQNFPIQRSINKANYSNMKSYRWPNRRPQNYNFRTQRGRTQRYTQAPYRPTTKGRNTRYTHTNAPGSELQEAIQNSRRFSNRRGNFRGGRRRFNNRTANLTKESLDAQLDSYMGDDAIKSRLDMELYNYFNGNINDTKQMDYEDVPMDGTM